MACQVGTASALVSLVVLLNTDAHSFILQDASDAISARAVCRSWRAASEQLRHPRLTVYTDNDEQLLRIAEGLRTSVRVCTPLAPISKREPHARRRRPIVECASGSLRFAKITPRFADACGPVAILLQS